MPLILLGLFACALLLGLLFTRAAIPLSTRLGFLDAPGGRKDHARPTPLGGGIAVMLAVGMALAAALAAAHFAWHYPEHFPRLAFFRDYLGGIPSRLAPLAILMGCTSGICVLGWADDRWKLSPGTKLAVEIALASALYLLLQPLHFRITLFTPFPWLWGVLTVLWIVGVTNAFNFIDNMDGLCAAVACVAAGFLAFLGLQGDQIFIVSLALLLAGALAGFLAFNVPPARIFLGDAGSLPVGFFLASLTVLLTFYDYRQGQSPWALAAPFLVLAIPLFDMITVLWIRYRLGRRFDQADRNHFSHRLLRLGFTPRQTLFLIVSLGFLLGISAALLRELPPGAIPWVLLQSAGLLAVIYVLERAGGAKGSP